MYFAGGWDMKIIASSALAWALILSRGVTPAFGGGKDAAIDVPQYNIKTEVDFIGAIAKVREVPRGEALAGIHLTIQSKGDAIEVYLGPADFIKLMDVPLRAGSKDVGVTGSKVKFDGNDLVLARELRVGKTVLSLRDEKGFPNWLWVTRGITSGF
jgi:hypothetical protein